MKQLDLSTTKISYATRLVPLETMAGTVPLRGRPRAGQLVLCEVLKLGRNRELENRNGLGVPIFPGDRVIGVFGNRYATSQYEGYVPARVTRRCDLLSRGGLAGKVASAHEAMRSPTRLKIIGLVADEDGQPLTLRSFALPMLPHPLGGAVILVVGSAMDSGKTTLAATLIRALRKDGHRVAAAKITGTVAARDCNIYRASGAIPVLDFVDAGHASTYMLPPEELFELQQILLSQLHRQQSDFVIIEIADGLFQRETRMLLASESFRRSIDHVFLAAADSMSAESGVRQLRGFDLAPRAVSGLVSRSPLLTRETIEATGVPCLSIDQIMRGEARQLLGLGERASGRNGRQVVLPLPLRTSEDGAGAASDSTPPALTSS